MKNIEYSGTLGFDDAPHFSEREFSRIGCKKSDCNPASLRRLERLREIVNEPLVLSSAFRSVTHELSKGRNGKSAHTLGRAFDIVCPSDALRYKIVAAALQVGFTRIGIGRNFVHVDDSESHPTYRIWTYYN